MEYARKLVYCKNKKDTEELYEMLLNENNDCYEIVAKSITNQTWDAEWRNLIGIKFLGAKLLFSFTTDLEDEHPDAFYSDPAFIDVPEQIGSKIKKAKTKKKKKLFQREFLYDTTQHTSFPAGELFLWLEGGRGNLDDGYNLFGIDDLAMEILYLAYMDDCLEDQYLKDGKINLDVALPWMREKVATRLYGEDGARIIREVQIIDIDGLEDPDYVLNEFFNHDYL